MLATLMELTQHECNADGTCPYMLSAQLGSNEFNFLLTSPYPGPGIEPGPPSPQASTLLMKACGLNENSS